MNIISPWLIFFYFLHFYHGSTGAGVSTMMEDVLKRDNGTHVFECVLVVKKNFTPTIPIPTDQKNISTTNNVTSPVSPTDVDTTLSSTTSPPVITTVSTDQTNISTTNNVTPPLSTTDVDTTLSSTTSSPVITTTVSTDQTNISATNDVTSPVSPTDVDTTLSSTTSPPVITTTVSTDQTNISTTNNVTPPLSTTDVDTTLSSTTSSPVITTTVSTDQTNISTTNDVTPPVSTTYVDTTLSSTTSSPSNTTAGPEIIKRLVSLNNLRSRLQTDGADVCKKNQNVQLLIIVDSASNDMNLRSVMRTWCKFYKLRKNQVQIVFFVGSPMNPMQEMRLMKENRINTDMVLTNVPDTSKYYSTMKSVSWLHWVLTQCSKAKFILKINSNMIVNIPNVLQFIRKNKFSRFTLWGYKEPIPMSNGSRYLGNAYLMTRDSVQKLFCGSFDEIDYNPNENQYITGMVAENKNIRVLDNNNFKLLNYATTCLNIRDNFLFNISHNSYSDWINFTLLLEECEAYLKQNNL